MTCVLPRVAAGRPAPLQSRGLITCENPATPLKTWGYTLAIENFGGAPFVAFLVLNKWTVPNTAAPTPVDATAFFTRAFGGTTIAGGRVQTPLCAAGDFDSWSLVWSFSDASWNGPFEPP